MTDQLSTAGNAIYTAKGILETEQETIIATRNAEVVTTSVNETQSLTRTLSQQVESDEERRAQDPADPLAQSFSVKGEKKGDGRFITSIDVFFSAKDAVLPVDCQIRTMINGYPARKILPLVRKFYILLILIHPLMAQWQLPLLLTHQFL